MNRDIIIHGKGLKNDQDKPAWDLLPWAELSEVVKVLTFGAKKYKKDNWKHVKDGQSRYFSAAMRHLAAIESGERLDSETGLDHHAHAACSILFAFWHSRENRKKRANDDGPNYGDGS